MKAIGTFEATVKRTKIALFPLSTGNSLNYLNCDRDLEIYAGEIPNKKFRIFHKQQFLGLSDVCGLFLQIQSLRHNTQLNLALQ